MKVKIMFKQASKGKVMEVSDIFLKRLAYQFVHWENGKKKVLEVPRENIHHIDRDYGD